MQLTGGGSARDRELRRIVAAELPLLVDTGGVCKMSVVLTHKRVSMSAGSPSKPLIPLERDCAEPQMVSDA